MSLANSSSFDSSSLKLVMPYRQLPDASIAASLPHCLAPKVLVKRVICPQLELFQLFVPSHHKPLLVETSGMILPAGAALSLWKTISNTI